MLDARLGFLAKPTHRGANNIFLTSRYIAPFRALTGRFPRADHAGTRRFGPKATPCCHHTRVRETRREERRHEMRANRLWKALPGTNKARGGIFRWPSLLHLQEKICREWVAVSI